MGFQAGCRLGSNPTAGARDLDGDQGHSETLRGAPTAISSLPDVTVAKVVMCYSWIVG
jgi:hypothetical protein